MQRNELQPQDASALRAANLPYFAEQCEALGEAIQKKQVIDETAKLQEINAAAFISCNFAVSSITCFFCIASPNASHCSAKYGRFAALNALAS